MSNEAALTTIAVVGAFTALFAATIALRQFDLKKVFAYSTVSQLGFMFVGVGVLAPVAGVFHLVTHAFFKALLFLSSGVVMHAMMGTISGKADWFARLEAAGVPMFDDVEAMAECAALVARYPALRERARIFVATNTSAREAKIAVRAPSGKLVSYADVSKSGRARLFTAKGCEQS